MKRRRGANIVKRRSAIVLASSLLLAGCSSNSDGGDASASADETVQSVAAMLGCSATLERDGADERELFVADSGACTIGNERIFIRDFGTPESQENWWNAAKEFGATPDQGVTVGVTFVEPDSPDWIERVRGTLLEGSPAPEPEPSSEPEEDAMALGDAEDLFWAFLVEESPSIAYEELRDDWIALAKDACDALDGGADIESVFDTFADQFTEDEASTFVVGSVGSFCPTYEDELA